MEMRKGWLWILIGMLAVAAASWLLFLWLSPPPLPEGLLYGNGRIEATEVMVSAEVSARVIESHLVEGGSVEAGTVLVRLDVTDLRTRLKQAEAGAAAAERVQVQVAQQLRTWRHHLETATADLGRYRQLREADSISAQMLDQAEDRFREAQGQVEALTAQEIQAAAKLEAERLEIQFLQSQVDKALVRAPIAGTILVKGIETGEIAAPSRTVAVLADLARVELKIYIPQTEIGRIKLNDPARVRVDAFHDRYFEARVARVDPRAQFTPRDVHMPDERARLVFGVVLALVNPEGYLKPGMPADAWVRWQPEAPWPDRLLVPR